MLGSPRVLHVSECLLTGVATAIGDFVSHDVAEHHVLGDTQGHQLEARIARHAASFSELPQGHLGRITAVQRAARRIQPDIIHAHSSLAGAAVRLAPIPKGRIAYSPHCFSFERRDIGRPLRAAFWAAEAALSARTAIFGVASTREAELARRFPGKPNVAMLPYAVSTANRSARERRPPSKALTIVSSGRACAQKDPLFFARAAQLSPGDRWCWVGGGDQSLEDRLRGVGVEVTGLLAREAALERVACADVYMHTALWEGFPITVVEAAGLGLPLIVRASPSVEEAGIPLVTTPEDAVAAVDSLRRAPAWQDSLQRSAELAARFSPGAQAEALRQLYGAMMRGLQ